MYVTQLLRKSISGEYFTDADVSILLGAGAHSRLSRLVLKGDIYRIRRGLFVFSEHWRKGVLNKFSLSNIIYGPSYISLESALSHYGLIPEGVHTAIAVTSKRTKKFETPLGLFSYRKVPENGFELGVVSLEEGKKHFLIATPERCLIDKIYLDYVGPNSNILDYLAENLRMEISDLQKLNFNSLHDIAMNIGNKKLYSCVSELIRLLKLT